MRRHLRLYYPFYATALIVLAFLPGFLGIGWGEILGWMSPDDPIFFGMVTLGVISFIGFLVIPAAFRYGAIVIVPPMSAGLVTHLGKPAWLIANADLHRYEWLKGPEFLRRIAGGLRIVGIPRMHKLLTVKVTKLATVVERTDGNLTTFELQFGAPEDVKFVSLRDQVLQLVFSDPITANGIRLKISMRVFYRVDGPRKFFLAAEDWTRIVVDRIRPLVRHIVSSETWPEINKRRTELSGGIMRAVQDPSRPMLRAGGVEDNRSVVKFLMQEYGLIIQAFEFGDMLPAKSDIIEAGEQAFEEAQRMLGAREVAKFLRDESAEEVAARREAMRLAIATKAAENVKNIIVGGPVQEIFQQVFGPREEPGR